MSVISSNPLTVGELLDVLSLYPREWAIKQDGCDCILDTNGVRHAVSKDYDSEGNATETDVVELLTHGSYWSKWKSKGDTWATDGETI